MGSCNLGVCVVSGNIQKSLEQYNEYVRIRSGIQLKTFLLELLDIDAASYESYEEVYDSDASYRVMFDMLKEHCPFTVVVENHYVDRMYRDSYYLYYASKHRQYSRYCKRVVFFKGALKDITSKLEKNLEKRFMGSMVIRPLPHGKIGRSLLNPYYFADRSSFLRYATYNVVVQSKQLRINAFPYSMQDGETTSCAEVTILNLIDYFSRKYQDYRIALPSEVFERIDRHGYERTLPTKGLQYSEISRVFSEVGFFPRLYSVPSFQNNYQFKRNMHYYVESGIPVAMGIQRMNTKELHSITCIGHGEAHFNQEELLKRVRVSYNRNENTEPIWVVDTADLFAEYVVMDDGKRPYEMYRWRDINQTDGDINSFSVSSFSFGDADPKNMMVPLYKRMFLEAEDAYDLFVENLSRLDFGIRKMTGLDIGTKENPLVLRIFLASSRHFRQIRIENLRANGSNAASFYSATLFPKFVWVCELYSIETYLDGDPELIGEIVLDATASSHDSENVIIFNYGTTIRIMDPLCSQKISDGKSSQNENNHQVKDGETEYFYDNFYAIDRVSPLKPYTHNLHTPNNE